LTLKFNLLLSQEVSGQSEGSNAIAAQFAAQVAAKLYHPKDGEGPPSHTPPPSAHQQASLSQGAVPGAMPSGDHAHQATTGSNPVQVVLEQPPVTTPTQSVHVDSATADNSKTHQSLSNGRPAPPSEVVQTSEVPPVAVVETVTHVDSASNAKKSLETSEPVTVSVISAPVVSERTNVSEERSDSSSAREITPEVNIVPPTPVEKKPDMKIPEISDEPTKTEEPTAEVSGMNHFLCMQNYCQENEESEVLFWGYPVLHLGRAIARFAHFLQCFCQL
jgi:hypothetical protein